MKRPQKALNVLWTFVSGNDSADQFIKVENYIDFLESEVARLSPPPQVCAPVSPIRCKPQLSGAALETNQKKKKKKTKRKT